MSVLEGLTDRYNQMDEVDRKNFWLAVAGAIFLLIAAMFLTDTMNSLGGIFGEGAEYVNESVGGMQNIGNP